MNELTLAERNDALLRLLDRLRHDIDVNRTISLNADRLNKSDIDAGPFVGYLQKATLESISIYICKIYEPEGTRYLLNSIPAISAALAPYEFTETVATELATFGRAHAPQVSVAPTVEYLRSICSSKLSSRADVIDRFKTFRDKIGAHSESGVSISALPSHAIFEDMFRFGLGFYKFVRVIIGGSGRPLLVPLLIPRSFGF